MEIQIPKSHEDSLPDNKKVHNHFSSTSDADMSVKMTSHLTSSDSFYWQFGTLKSDHSSSWFRLIRREISS